MCCRGSVKELKNKQRSIMYSDCKISNNLKHGRKVKKITQEKIVLMIALPVMCHSVLLRAIMVLVPCTSYIALCTGVFVQVACPCTYQRGGSLSVTVIHLNGEGRHSLLIVLK